MGRQDLPSPRLPPLRAPPPHEWEARLALAAVGGLAAGLSWRLAGQSLDLVPALAHPVQLAREALVLGFEELVLAEQPRDQALSVGQQGVQRRLGGCFAWH